MDALEHTLQVYLPNDNAALTHLPAVLASLSASNFARSQHLRKFVTRVTSLIHSKESHARWTGMCIAQHCFSLDRDSVVEHAHVWVSYALPLLSRKEHPSLWKAAILLLDTIFVTASSLSEFQRQVVNPNAVKFGTALAALAEKGELQVQVLALSALTRLFRTYPTLVRSIQQTTLTLTFRFLRGRGPVSQQPSLVTAAAKLCAVRHLAGGKVGGATAWKECMDTAIATANAQLDELRSTFHDGRSTSAMPTSTLGQQADPLASLPTALDSLRGMTTLISEMLLSPSERPLPVPVGSLVAFTLRLLRATAEESLEHAYDKTKRAIQAAMVPELWQWGCQLVFQISASIDSHLSGYVSQLLPVLVIRLEQSSKHAAGFLQAILALSTRCASNEDPHLLARLGHCLVSQLARVVSHASPKQEIKQDPSGEKRGKKRGAYEGEELFGVGGTATFKTKDEGKTVLLTVENLAQLLRNPALPTELHNLAVRLVISVALQLGSISPASLSLDESLHAHLLASISVLAQEIAAGRSTMSQSVGLVARLAGEHPETSFTHDLDVLLRPRLPPIPRTRAILDASTPGVVVVPETSDARVSNSRQELNSMNVDPSNVVEHLQVAQVLAPQQAFSFAPAAAVISPLPPNPVATVSVPTLVAPKPSVPLQAADLEAKINASAVSHPLAAERPRIPQDLISAPSTSTTYNFPPPLQSGSVLPITMDDDEDDDEMPSIDPGSDSGDEEECL
ncbi:rRNA processing/ribosome biogenesis-domain-containing protein [Auriculariales sp. MPI-PUGE-AT-0066]|nr:rRNA processing/ribosome biogenesis-domain-containing protein [Auriculariales sp. MPI-PUGE-AT-0066]